MQRLLKHTKLPYKRTKPNLIKRRRSVLRGQRLSLMGHVCNLAPFRVLVHPLAIQRHPAAMAHRPAFHLHPLCRQNVLQELRRNQTERVCKAEAYQASVAVRATTQDQAIAAVLQATVADQAIAAEHQQTVLQGQQPNLTERVCKVDQQPLSEVVQIIATLIQAAVWSFIQVMQRHHHNHLATTQVEATALEMITCQFGSNLN